MKFIKRFLFVLLVIIGLSGIGFVVWGSTPARAMDEAVSALQSDALVKVDQASWLVFTPQRDEKITTGYIFYPGGRVDYRAYAPYARAVAEQGYLVIIPRMPLNLAVFGINSAEKIIAAHPEVDHWVLGGHSLGGSMAANYIYEHPNEVSGLVLLASYPAESNDLSRYEGLATTISASLDGLATSEKIQTSLSLLPPDTIIQVIEGGNHAYFGWYGAQKGDNTAVITREEQQKQLIEATLQLLNKIGQ